MIDIEKFICSLLADHPEGVAVRGDIHRALKEQGLEYKDGKIVPIEDNTELKESDERIRKGIIRNLEYLMDRAEGFAKDELKERIAWLEKQGEQKLTQRKDFISIPFGAFDSELIEETIIIPDGCVATIESNKIHIKREDL